MREGSSQYLEARAFDSPQLAAYQISVAELFPANDALLRRSAEEHERYTAPEILRLLPNLAFVGMSVGSGKMLAGVGEYLNKHAPGVKIVAELCPETAAAGSNDSWRRYPVRIVHVETESAGWRALEQFLLVPGLSTRCLLGFRNRAVAFVGARQGSLVLPA